MASEPRHRVDSKLIVVLTVAVDLLTSELELTEPALASLKNVFSI